MIEKNIYQKLKSACEEAGYVKKGEKIENCYRSVRPGYGLHPKYFNEIKNYVATKDLEVGDRVDWDSIKKDS